jgi:hypothetical protein
MNCPVCHGKDPVHLNDLPLLYRCELCTHTFSGAPSDPNAVYSDDYYVEDHKNWFDHPNTELFEFIGSSLPPGGGGCEFSTLAAAREICFTI